jgi:hypothetical protein
MAIIQSSNHLLARSLLRRAAVVERAPDAPSAGPSLAQGLGHLGRALLGVLLLLLGSALVLTLWLLPVGLPLALLGTALIAAPRGPGPRPPGRPIATTPAC